MEFLSGEELEEQQACFPLVNSSCRRQLRSRSESVLIYTLFSSVSLLTVLLNLLVLISIYHFKQLHTPTNMLIFSLALADLLVGLLIMPVETIRTVESCWYLGRFMCAFYPYAAFVLTSASLGNLVLISVDRYIAVCDPLRYPSKITLRKTVVYITLSWTSCFIYNAWLLFEHISHPYTFNRCHGECLVVYLSISGIIDIVITFLGPCSVIIVLYMKVFVVAISQAQSLRVRVCAETGFEKTRKSERKAARTLGIVVLIFLICFTPYFCTAFSPNSPSQLYITWVLQVNSCLNPLIYAFFYPWFKRATKLILTLKILESSSSEFNVL